MPDQHSPADGSGEKGPVEQAAESLLSALKHDQWLHGVSVYEHAGLLASNTSAGSDARHRVGDAARALRKALDAAIGGQP